MRAGRPPVLRLLCAGRVCSGPYPPRGRLGLGPPTPFSTKLSTLDGGKRRVAIEPRFSIHFWCGLRVILRGNAGRRDVFPPMTMPYEAVENGWWDQLFGHTPLKDVAHTVD